MTSRQNGATTHMRKIDRLQRRFDLAVAQIRPRLASAALYGSATAPAPVSLTPLPQHLLDRAASLRTEALGALVGTLERDLNDTLLPAPSAKTEQATVPSEGQGFEEGEAAEVEAEVVEDAAPMYVEEVNNAPVHREAEGAEDAVRRDWVDFNASPRSNDR